MTGDCEPRVTATAAEITRHFGDWQAKAFRAPVIITHHGRPRLVLSSVELFDARSPIESSAQATETRAKLEALLIQMNEPFYALDPDFRVIELNAAAELYFGLSRDQIVGSDLRDVLPETRDSVAWSFYTRVLNTGERVEFEVAASIRGRLKLHVRAFPYNGAGVGILFSTMTAIEEVGLLKQRNHAVMELLKCEPALCIISLNVRGGIKFADDAFCEMSGFSRQQLSTIMLLDVVRSQDRAPLLRTLNAALSQAHPKIVEATVLVRDGSERRLIFSMCGVTNDTFAEEVVVLVTDAEKRSAGLSRG